MRKLSGHDHIVYDVRMRERMNEHAKGGDGMDNMILALYPEDARFGLCEAEGFSAKLGSGVMGQPAGYDWFEFEEDWPTTCMELQNLGFTATQVLEAAERG